MAEYPATEFIFSFHCQTLTEMSALHLGRKANVSMSCETDDGRKYSHERLTNGVHTVGEVLLGLDITVVIFIETLSNGVLSVIV
jgi:hypothetical protein